jgi:polyhydroxybutyrate depolymerase
VTIQSHELIWEGLTRTYLTMSSGAPPEGIRPVVIDLHGSGCTPGEQITASAPHFALNGGALVVVPEGALPFRLQDSRPLGRAWNVPGAPLPGETTARASPDDVRFIAALIDHVVEHFRADPRRIHLRGFSGGARLATHLAARLGDRLASVTCVSGVRFVDSAAPTVPPVLAIHGMDDQINPYWGNDESRWGDSVEQVIERWAVRAGCAAEPQRCPTPGPGVNELRYLRADGFEPVRLISLAGVGHSWPGTVDKEHIAQFGAAGAFSASKAHWHFVCDLERWTGQEQLRA